MPSQPFPPLQWGQLILGVLRCPRKGQRELGPPKCRQGHCQALLAPAGEATERYLVPLVTFTALWWKKLLGEEGRLLLVSLPPRQQHPLPQAPAQSPPGTAPALFFFLMEEVKSSVYLAKKNPWNSSWPFLKYNKEAELLTTGRAALTCRQSSSTSAWGGEEAPESTRKAAPSSRGKGSDSRTWFFPGAGSTEHGSCVRQMHQPLSPPWLEACENCDVLWTR